MPAFSPWSWRRHNCNERHLLRPAMRQAGCLTNSSHELRSRDIPTLLTAGSNNNDHATPPRPISVWNLKRKLWRTWKPWKKTANRSTRNWKQPPTSCENNAATTEHVERNETPRTRGNPRPPESPARTRPACRRTATAPRTTASCNHAPRSPRTAATGKKTEDQREQGNTNQGA